MSVNLIATLEVKAAMFADFTVAMGKIAAIVEANGWRLVDAYVLRTGQLNTVIDVWELPDYNALDTGMAAVASSPQFASIGPVIGEAVIKETLVFANRLAYPGRESR